MEKILLVEDEEKISKIIAKYLESEGFEVDRAKDGREGLALFKENPYDLILLDRMIPLMSGDELIKEIRKLYPIPIIMVTAKVEEEDIITGLRSGADDYIVKPFNPRELIERVKAVLRRSKMGSKGDIISYNKGELVINKDNHTVEKKGENIQLTRNEFEILSILFSKTNKIFTREEIISLAFGEDYDGYDRAVDTHIKNIRQKLEDDPKKPKYIKTVYGVGYKVGGED